MEVELDLPRRAIRNLKAYVTYMVRKKRLEANERKADVRRKSQIQGGKDKRAEELHQAQHHIGAPKKVLEYQRNAW